MPNIPEKLQLCRGGFGCSASLCASTAEALASTSATAAAASRENLTRIMVELPCKGSASFSRSNRGFRPRQHSIGDRCGDRLCLLRKAENRHDDEKERKISERQDARDDRQPLGRLLRAEIAEANADRDEDPEEKAIGRAVLRRLDRGAVEPGNERQHDDRRQQDDHAPQLFREAAQQGVERKQR